MRCNILALAVAACAVTVSTVSIPDNHVLHEKRSAPLKNWVKRSKVDPRTTLPMRIGLMQSNIHNGVGEKLMGEV